MNNATVLDVARGYVARGWRVVPIPERRKGPILSGWQHLELDVDDLPRHFTANGVRPNIGVILGKPSGGLVDVDLDTPTAGALGALWLPETGAVFGRAGKRCSHYLYRASDGEGPVKTLQFEAAAVKALHGTTAMLVELRSTGAQTVFPGSVHETGEPIEWVDDGDPATVDVGELERTARWIAAGALLTPFWTEGVRNHLGLALAGALLRAQWSVDDAGAFVEGVARVAGDLEWARRRGQCVEPTARKLADGTNVVGVPTLAELIGDPAIVKAVATWLKLGSTPSSDASTTPATDTSFPSGKPEIDAGIQALPVVTAAAWDALRQANDPNRLFQHADTVSRLERSTEGHLGISALEEHGLRYEVARAARWYQVKKDRATGLLSEVDARPPLDVMRDMLATPSEKRPLPVLTRLVQAPIYSPTGELLTAPGYHPAARVYYDPPPGVTLPSVPARPTGAEVARARSLIMDDLMGDFPFVGAAERAHAVALLLLPFVRDMIPGNTPLHLVDAPSAGTGKGLLVNALLTPSLGGNKQLMSAANDDDEWRKRITAALAGAPGAIQIDNVARVFASPDLAAALTTTEWSDRLLGQSRLVRYPVRCVWVATGNNMTLSTEIARRSVHIRMNPQRDLPWERQESAFRHPDLLDWVRSSRGRLVGAALTLVNAWLTAGRPTGKKTIGSYEEWSRLMGGILAVADVPGFLANTHEFYEEADTEAAVQRRLVAAWWEAFKEEEVGTAELFPIAETIEGLTFGRSTSERGQRTALGAYVAKVKDRVYNDYRVAKGSVRDNRQLWRLRWSGGAPMPPEGAPHDGGNHPHDAGDGSNLSNLSNLSAPIPRGRAGAHTHTHTCEGGKKVTEVTEVTEVKPEEVLKGFPPLDLRPCPGCGTPSVNGWTCKACRERPPAPVQKVATSAEKTIVQPTATSTTLPVVTGDAGPALPYTLVTTARDVGEMLTTIGAADVVGIDTETTGLDAATDRVRLIQIATAATVYVLDVFTLDPRLIAPLLVGDGPLLVGHNLAFDLRFLESAGLPFPAGSRLFDTMLASQLLAAGTRMKHSLAAVAERALGIAVDKTEQKSNWSGRLSSDQLAYAAQDAALLPALATRLRESIDAADLGRVADLEMRALPTIAWIEQTGVPFDRDAWTGLATTAAAERDAVAQELTAAVGSGGLFAGSSTVNWGSNMQVAALLRARGHTVTSTDDVALHALGDAGEPLAALLLRHRDAAKRASTYGADYLKHVNARTGRIHPHFGQLGSDAGRMTCASPNLQQVPRDRRYRACFRPGEGRVLIKADYAQIELRLAAEIADDTRLIEAFQRGDDLHTVTARTVLGKTEVTTADRQAAKAVNFGLLYGMGVEGLRIYAKNEYGVQWSVDEAASVRGKFFDTYRGLKAWHRSQPDGAVDTRTIAGRRREGLTSFTKKLNSPVQGSGADGLKAALALLGETRGRARGAAAVNVVHDEIVVECDRDEAEAARAWVMDAMRTGMESVLCQVPAEVEATICADWSGTPVDPGRS